jgi:ATP-dependent exoDNAse (exonuclease V) alpha subunit
VLLVDLDDLPVGTVGESLLYIGMSRASAVLQMVVPPGFGERLEQLVRRTD